MSKELKVTVEYDGNKQEMEANGIAAVLLHDGNDERHHGIQVCLAGNLSVQDLIHLKAAVEEELLDVLNKNIEEDSRSNLADFLQGILDDLRKGE